jgi:ParB family chromosome partitioning protein
VSEIGRIKDPIHVRKKRDGLCLLAGGHRIAAYIELGVTEVDAWVWADITDDFARMIEIDDNLAGAEMCPLDTAIFLARRKEVYERLHPETKRGGDRRSQGFQTDIVAVSSFSVSTAEKFGIDERHVRRLVAAGSRLSAKDIQLLRSAPQGVSLKDLSDLSKLGDAVSRYDVVEAFSAGRAKKISEAIKARAAREAGIEPTLKDPVEEAFKALSSIWARAPMAAKRRFLEERADEIAQIIDGGAV